MSFQSTAYMSDDEYADYVGSSEHWVTTIRRHADYEAAETALFFGYWQQGEELATEHFFLTGEKLTPTPRANQLYAAMQHLYKAQENTASVLAKHEEEVLGYNTPIDYGFGEIPF